MKEKIKHFYFKEEDNIIINLISSVILIIISLLFDNIFLFTYALLKVPFLIIFYVIRFIIVEIIQKKGV